MTNPSRAPKWFLSYASEDAVAAQRLAEALRSAGMEVWFDREELRGGDAWDQKIRQQIRDCRLFVPIISAHTALPAREHLNGKTYRSTGLIKLGSSNSR
jgi:hypothetical protein